MATSQKKTRQSAGKSKSKAQAPRKKPRRPSNQRLKAPRWQLWIAKGEVAILQAALLTMGLSPDRGVVTLLKNRPRKKADLRQRKAAIEAAYGNRFPRTATLPKRVTVRDALEFAIESGWVVPKNAKNALEAMRHLSPQKPFASGPDLKLGHAAADGGAARPQVELHPLLPGLPSPVENTPTKPAPDAATSSYGLRERRSQQILGAVLVLLHRIEKRRDKSSYVRNGALNQTTLVEEIMSIVGEENGTSGAQSFSGLSDSNIRTYLRDALSIYGKAYTYAQAITAD